MGGEVSFSVPLYCSFVLFGIRHCIPTDNVYSRKRVTKGAAVGDQQVDPDTRLGGGGDERGEEVCDVFCFCFVGVP